MIQLKLWVMVIYQKCHYFNFVNVQKKLKQKEKMQLKKLKKEMLKTKIKK